MEGESPGSISSPSALHANNGSITTEKDGSTTRSSGWRAQPLSEEEAAKVMQILQACRDSDLHALAALASSAHGLVEDEIRRTACNTPPFATIPLH